MASGWDEFASPRSSASPLAHYAVDALDQFLAGATRHRLLTAAEELELAKRIERGDLAAKERLITHNLRPTSRRRGGGNGLRRARARRRHGRGGGSCPQPGATVRQAVHGLAEPDREGFGIDGDP